MPMARHRKLRGIKLKKQKRLVLATIIGLTLILSSGYAAFSTNITLNAKGNIKGYTVTFDPNGGYVDRSSKRVKYGTTYGNLPTPTREGYTFKGWNGKNLVNIENHNVTISNYYYEDRIPTPEYALKPNTEYTLTFDYQINSANNSIYSSVGYGSIGFQKDIKSSSIYSGTGKLELNFTTPNTFNFDPPFVAFRFVRMSSPGDANVDISNIQLEEGNEATEWEPYYITSDTEVVQEKNHTLTAVWEENPQSQQPTN